MVEFMLMPGNHTPGNELVYRDIDSAIAEGQVLVGSARRVIDTIMFFHEAFDPRPAGVQPAARAVPA